MRRWPSESITTMASLATSGLPSITVSMLLRMRPVTRARVSRSAPSRPGPSCRAAGVPVSAPVSGVEVTLSSFFARASVRAEAPHRAAHLLGAV